MERFISGEQKKIFRIHSHNLFIGQTTDGKHVWQQEEEQKGDSSTALMIQGIIIYFRALQGHSGRNLIDPSLQDNVVIPSGFFQYIYHIGCGFNLHSIINSGLINTWRSEFEQETDSVLSAC